MVDIAGMTPQRGLMLPDWTTFDWLLLARGIATGNPERCVWDAASRELQFTFPVPPQVRRTLRLIGHPADGWKWRIADGADETLWRIWGC